MSDGQAAPGEIAPALPPEEPARLFSARAARLAALAAGHPAAEYLELLTRLARGQSAAAGAGGDVPAPEEASVTRDHPPLEALRRAPAARWRGPLSTILDAARRGPLPSPARDAMERLARATDPELDALATAVLAGRPRDLATAPFVGAALQVLFTRAAARLDPAAVRPGEVTCPACGAPPVAATILANDRLRYVACSLCATRWHLPRVSCAACRATDAISYLEVEGTPAAARAEACDRCRTYLKVFDLAVAPSADPVADDAATIVLDLLVAERGHRRAGVNLLAPGGEPE